MHRGIERSRNMRSSPSLVRAMPVQIVQRNTDRPTLAIPLYRVETGLRDGIDARTDDLAFKMDGHSRLFAPRWAMVSARKCSASS